MANGKDFSGKVVIVTGSSSGIGEGTAILFAKLGAHVVVTGLNADDVKRVADICLSVSPKRLKPLEVTADITDDKEASNLIESTVKEFGKIDVLVNNAGAAWFNRFTDQTLMESYDLTLRLLLRAVVYLSHLSVPHLEKTKGNIVNISSVGGIRPLEWITPYSIAKCALDMFTKCLAVELGPKGIRVNGINTGVVKTNIVGNAGKREQLLEIAKKASPLGIHGEPVDLAYSVAFLASDEASFITGTNMVVDGGALWTLSFKELIN